MRDAVGFDHALVAASLTYTFTPEGDGERETTEEATQRNRGID